MIKTSYPFSPRLRFSRSNTISHVQIDCGAGNFCTHQELANSFNSMFFCTGQNIQTFASIVWPFTVFQRSQLHRPCYSFICAGTTRSPTSSSCFIKPATKNTQLTASNGSTARLPSCSWQLYLLIHYVISISQQFTFGSYFC